MSDKENISPSRTTTSSIENITELCPSRETPTVLGPLKGGSLSGLQTGSNIASLVTSKRSFFNLNIDNTPAEDNPTNTGESIYFILYLLYKFISNYYYFLFYASF